MSQGIKPNADMASSILKMNNTPEAADYLLADMASWKISPNDMIATEVVKFCDDNLDKAFLVIDRFNRRGTNLGPQTYSKVLPPVFFYTSVFFAHPILFVINASAVTKLRVPQPGGGGDECAPRDAAATHPAELQGLCLPLSSHVGAPRVSACVGQHRV